MSALLGEVLDYLERTRTARSTFGRLVNGDWRLVQDMAEGRKVNERIAEQIANVMADHPDCFARVPKREKTRSNQPEGQVGIDAAKARVASDRLRKATLFVQPSNAAPRTPLTFEEQLARVASGRATISPTFQRYHLTPTVRAA